MVVPQCRTRKAFHDYAKGDPIYAYVRIYVVL
jgi:hypothetical protein